jgi:hypothetical protein
MNRLSQMFTMASLVLLAACGADPDPDATAAGDAAPKPEARAAKAPDDPTAKMARAVGDGKPGAAVEIRYEILDKPEVGKPTQIEVAFIPRAGVDSLDATISGMEGITVAGDLKAHFEKVDSGKPYQHTFSLLPDRAGVYYVTVSVTTTLGGASIGRTFSIPFVVGAPVAQQKATPPKDASGQAIESMKAEESRG